MDDDDCFVFCRRQLCDSNRMGLFVGKGGVFSGNSCFELTDDRARASLVRMRRKKKSPQKSEALSD
jgi:hypothetical protein